MLIYNYDAETKEYTYSEEACLDPEETKKKGKNVYLIPANATKKKPPTPQTNEAVVFNNTSWQIIPDYRGMYMVNENMQPQKVESFGELPQGYIPITAEQAAIINTNPYYYIWDNNTIIVNPDREAEELNAAKTAKYAENDSKAAQSRYSKEFTLILQDKVCVFDTKETTQADLLTAFAVCSTGTTYDGWVTNNGVEFDLTFEDVAAIAAEFKSKSNVYPQWAVYKRAIDSAQTVEEVEAIEINYD